MEKKSVAKNYAFLAIMLGSMILGAIVGWFMPVTDTSAGATIFKPLGSNPVGIRINISARSSGISEVYWKG